MDRKASTINESDEKTHKTTLKRFKTKRSIIYVTVI